jgi:hypothetical protein
MNKPTLQPQSNTMLDNPIWRSLAMSHAKLALGADVGILNR